MLRRLLAGWWRGSARRAPGATVDDILDRARSLQAADDLAACRVLEEGIALLPAEPQLWNGLGLLQLRRNYPAAAEAHFRRALTLRSDFAEARSNLGIALSQQGRSAEGMQAFQQAIAAAPGLLEARENLAKLLTNEMHNTAALAAWGEVLRLRADHPEAHAAMGILQMRAGRYDAARTLLARARSLGVDTPHLRLHEALVDAPRADPLSTRRALASLRGQIEDADLDWNAALIHLAEGEFAQGWPLYEARLRKSVESPRRDYPFPEWEGEPLAAGELLVMAEQGLGDEIMFASCYADTLARAPRCVIECDVRLAGLFQGSFPHAAVVGMERRNDKRWLAGYPRLRRQIHAGSLPRLFRRSAGDFPRHDGYLRPDAERIAAWRERLAAPGKAQKKVGIAWSGGLPHTRRELRCVPLAELAPLLRDMRQEFVSLQYDDDGSGAAELAALSGVPVQVFPEALRDLEEMAALMRALDLVITVCSSAAHLCGAIGARAWVLTPHIPEWRYLRSGETLPWYPSVTLFRQRSPEAWSPVLAEVADALRALALHDA